MRNQEKFENATKAFNVKKKPQTKPVVLGAALSCVDRTEKAALGETRTLSLPLCPDALNMLASKKTLKCSGPQKKWKPASGRGGVRR